MEIRNFWRAMSAMIIAATVAVALVVTGLGTAAASGSSDDDPLDGPCAMTVGGVTGTKVEASGPTTTGTVVVLDTTTSTWVSVRVVISGSEVHFYRGSTNDPIAVTYCIKAGPTNTGLLGPASSGSTAGVLANVHGTALDISHVVVYRATSSTGPSQDVALSIEKSVDVSHAAPGDVVSYRLVVHNSGPAAAAGVVVTDNLPAGTTYVSATPPCTHSGQAVTCSLGTVAAGPSVTIDVHVRVDAVSGADVSHDHQFDVTKIESHLSLAGGQTGSATTTCPTGYVATDGSVRLDAVDQGTGTFADAVVLVSRATDDGRGWTGTVRNDATGQAQGKVNVVCISERTVSGEDHTHALVISAPVSESRVLGPGTATVDLTCGAGTVPITPGFAFTAGEGVVGGRVTSTGWQFHVQVPHSAAVDLSVRCLSTSLSVSQGHSHDLAFTDLSDTVSVPAGQVVTRSLTCRNGAKGIVAWVDPHGGLVPIGTDPQPVTRVYRFYNPTASELGADYGLLCLDVRTAGGPAQGGDLTNTAWVSTSSHDTTSGDNSDSATFRVTTSGVLPAPSGRVVTGSRGTQVKIRVASLVARSAQVRLLATSRVPGTHLAAGDELAGTSTRLVTGRRTVVLDARGAAAGALRHGHVQQARVVITAADGTRTVRVVRLG
jgi:uncharacterized repeat protein (TIGR01451 family)